MDLKDGLEEVSARGKNKKEIYYISDLHTSILWIPSESMQGT